ncbi:hypothetical protein HZC00_05160 [Candidatus Kaiserbacteria bacterium]|nr:hypothetical protein [Candidatus Kaiserbacteria bacterium]
MSPSKKTLYMRLSAVTGIILAFATSFVINGMIHTGALETYFYQLAFYTFIILILLIKLRVRMGFRTHRGHLFHIHLASSILFFVSLAALAFWYTPAWLEYTMWALYATALVTGTVLFYRGTMDALIEAWI